MVLPLSLQMLLENAIKHNVISNQNPLIIKVVQSNGTITVSNTLQKRNENQESKGHESSAQGSTGLGLSNIRSRYKFLTDEPLIVESNHEVFSVKLPLLTFA